jgi:hypothetical protein
MIMKEQFLELSTIKKNRRRKSIKTSVYVAPRQRA